ncbi:MAG TPA: heat-inducible transcriptional repressor HrcA [Chloroflexota bacterium]|jgi:heat-inducible transcriptional repressor|nr:heat-inducible transcriptional repressor HrcA [Chloroflexota bacterium]
MDRELTERQQAVLRMIVAEYVATAVPVGSGTIVRKYAPGVSPATVRNDMVTLASAGYVYHPHTSAGRIPSDKGYQYYVRHLMQPGELSADEKRMIVHLFHQIERDLGQWVQLAATLLAQMTGNAALVTAPRVARAELQHLELIATQERSALLIALLGEGMLHQQLLVHSEPLRQEELDQIVRRFNQTLRGRAAEEIAEWDGARTDLERAVRDCLAELMMRVDRQAVPRVWQAGLSLLLAQPEFASREKAQEITRAFEQPTLAVEVADALIEYPGVRVMIGDEVRWSVLRGCAVVGARYGADRRWGAIAVVGPTRMRYDRAIATIQYVSEVMTDLWAKLCG